MKTEINIEFDIRNHLYLLEETGTAVDSLINRYEEMEKRIPKKEREANDEWQNFAKEIYNIPIVFSKEEPSTLEEIKEKRATNRIDNYNKTLDESTLKDKIEGGWRGRIAGCILGKPVEFLMKERDSRKVLTNLLKESGEYPLNDFVSKSTIDLYPPESRPKWYQGESPSLREFISYAPADDDLDYTVISLDILKEYGKGFTPDNVLEKWVSKIPFSAVCTAEKMAYRNFVMGMRYPQTATFFNSYYEWIGAQIRTDLYGYISPGKVEEAAAMGFSDSAASHIANGIYGGMWVSAALASAFFETDVKTVIETGLAQIPQKSRFVTQMRITMEEAINNGEYYQKTFDGIQERLGNYHCVHTINNACIVAASLIHGEGDFGKTICIAVMGGLDTDCNGATAGSIAGLMLGVKNIEKKWIEPFNNTLKTRVIGRAENSIDSLVLETVEFSLR